MGYFLGGRLAYLMSTRTDIDASVGYYGVGIEGHLNEKDKIRCPLVLHFAGEVYPGTYSVIVYGAASNLPSTGFHARSGLVIP